MQRNQKEVSIGGSLLLCLVLLNAVVLEQAFITHRAWYVIWVLTLSLLIAGVILFKRKRL